MISAIRKQLQTIIFRIILFVLVMSLIGFMALPRLLNMRGTENWFARVNGTEISASDYERQLSQEKARFEMLRQQLGIYAHAFLGQLDIHKVAYDNLIQGALLDQLAASLDIHVGQQVVTQELTKALPKEVFDASGKIDPQLVLNYLPMYSSMQDLEDSIAQSIRREMVLTFARAGVYVPFFDVQKQYAATYAHKDYAFLVFDSAAYFKKAEAKKATEQELKAFFDAEANRQNYMIGEKRAGLMWTFTPENFGIEISDKAVESHYQKNKRSLYLESPTRIEIRHIFFPFEKTQEAAVRTTAQGVLDQALKDPKKFADLARKYSADKKTADKGGLLPAFSHGQKHQEVERAAFHVRTDGEVFPELIKTGEGFEIIQRVSRKQEVYKPFEKVKNDIKKSMIAQRFKGTFERLVARMITNGNPQEIEKTVADFVQRKQGKKVVLADVVKNESPSAKKLFGLRENGFGYFMTDASGAIVQLTSVQKSSRMALAAVRAKVEKDYYRAQAQKQLTADINAALRSAKQGTPLAQIAKEYAVPLEKMTQLNEKTAAGNEKVKKYALPVPQLMDMTKQGLVKEIFVGDNGYLVQLEAIKEIKPDDIAAQTGEIERQLRQSQLSVLERGFIASLYRNATIKRNEKLTSRYSNKRTL